MEKKCDFSISAAKLLYQTVKTCQYLKKMQKKSKKNGSTAPAMLPLKRKVADLLPQETLMKLIGYKS